MRLFSPFQQPKQPQISATEVEEIQERVRSMREQIGKRDVELVDLFALLGEDERPFLREMEEVKRPELPRFWPHQIPTARPETPNMEPQTPAYANLRAFVPSNLPTAP